MPYHTAEIRGHAKTLSLTKRPVSKSLYASHFLFILRSNAKAQTTNKMAVIYKTLWHERNDTMQDHAQIDSYRITTLDTTKSKRETGNVTPVARYQNRGICQIQCCKHGKEVTNDRETECDEPVVLPASIWAAISIPR